MDLDVTGLDRLLGEGDALLVVPPFAGLERPSLGLHLLQACAREAGYRVRVLYANLLFAARTGTDAYATLARPVPESTLAGELFFARAAHDLLPFGGALDAAGGRVRPLFAADGVPLDRAALERLEALTIPWAEETAALVARLGFDVVGVTTMFDQTNAALALLRRLRAARPGVTTLLGGANCEGEMGVGLADLAPYIDHVFSGESEQTFVDFLRTRRAARVVPGAPCLDLDALPLPDYTDYFAQRERLAPALSAGRILPYETSRGCWWGQKHHCTFCGLNGQGMAFRERSAPRALADLRALAAAHGSRAVAMADNIMPRGYFEDLLPALAAEPDPFLIFYEQKANLTLAETIALKQAGVSVIQPGIEALSSPLLAQMDKGVSARQNLVLLRNARAVGVHLEWNLLWAFPGDERAWYEDTLALLPLLRHLPPPSGFHPVVVERFSPYFDRPEAYGIRAVRPAPTYAAAFPEGARLDAIAYRFVADYDAGSRDAPALTEAITREVEA